MKNLLLLLLGAACIVSCGDSKIEAFARQKCHEKGVMDEDIESIKAEKTDSMLSDSYVVNNAPVMAKAHYDMVVGKMSAKDFDKQVQDYATAMDDVANSLQFGIAINDSLKKLDKYKSCWREGYMVTVTMKSGQEKQFRVICDRNGTPYMTEGELQQSIEDKTPEMLEWAKDAVTY